MANICMIFLFLAMVPEIRVSHGAEAVTLRGSMLIYEDKSGNKKVGDILLIPDSGFTLHESVSPSFGFTRSAYWAKTVIANGSRSNSYFLEIDNPLINSVELYYRDEETGRFAVSRAGNGMKSSLREVQHHNHVFEIPFRAGEKKEIFLRFRSQDHMTFPALLWDASSFVNNKILLYLFSGLFYGIMIAMIIYNAFLSVSLRNKGYLYYTLSIISFTFFFLAFNGFGFLYIWGAFPWFAIRATPVFVALVIVFVPMFTRHYLETDKHSRSFSRLLHIFSGAGMICLASLFVADLRTATQVTVACAIAVCLTVLVITFFYRRHNRRAVNYFMLAWTVLLVSAIVTALRSFAVLPDTFFVRYAAQFGVVFEVLVLSLGLADKIKILEDEKTDAQEEAISNKEMLIRNLQESEFELEQKVEERTASLAEANRQLNEANATKDKFFSIIAHDLKNPLTGMLLNTELLVEFIDRADKEKIRQRALSLHESGKSLSELVANLLEWSRSQMDKDGIDIRIEPNDMAATVGSAVGLASAMAAAKGISIATRTQGSSVWDFDENMIHTILRNLITNAVKFTPQNGNIDILIESGRDVMNVTVTDNGVGMSPENTRKLFRMDGKFSKAGTANEKGTGLGLLICKEFISRHGGSIDVVSEEGKGSSFIFSLPRQIAA